MHDAGFQTSSNQTIIFGLVLVGGFMVVGNLIAMNKANNYGRREAILACIIPMAVS
jgi:predicted MFS family arabinose efflux permease